MGPLDDLEQPVAQQDGTGVDADPDGERTDGQERVRDCLTATSALKVRGKRTKGPGNAQNPFLVAHHSAHPLYPIPNPIANNVEGVEEGKGGEKRKKSVQRRRAGRKWRERSMGSGRTNAGSELGTICAIRTTADGQKRVRRARSGGDGTREGS